MLVYRQPMSPSTRPKLLWLIHGAVMDKLGTILKRALMDLEILSHRSRVYKSNLMSVAPSDAGRVISRLWRSRARGVTRRQIGVTPRTTYRFHRGTMARAKRRSSTQHASPDGASTTPTSNSTPMFSSRNSVASETPMTTEIDEEALEHVKPPPKRARARRASAVQTLDSVPGRGRVQKRKAATSIEPVASNKKKRITRSSMKSELNNKETHSEGSEQEDTRHIVQDNGKGKGKGKARARETPPAAAASASDGSLSGEESDDSGSEFIVSDEDEEVMLDAAVRMSLQTSRSEAQNGASSSTVHNIELSLDIVRRAAAAERMVTQNHGVSDSDGFRMIADSDPELSFSDESSDDVRRRGKGKGKAKSKPKLKSKIDVKAVRAAMGRGLSNASELKERKALKAEEMAMSSKLCRKLTHVCT